MMVCGSGISTAAGTGPITKYAVQWAREFRYDGARQRYLNVQLDPVALMTAPSGSELPILSITRSDYDGDDVYADWSEPIPPSTDPPTLLRSFESGIGRVDPWTDAGGANTAYYHTDMLGTTRMMTGANGQPLPGYGTASMPTPATFTAFGERVCGAECQPVTPQDRYAYVGEHGYQAHEDFPYLHLGARYYDPAMGRFLQRDPIGINGGINVYLYASGRPASRVDGTGLSSLDNPLYERGNTQVAPDIASVSPGPSSSTGPSHSKLPGPFDMYHRIKATGVLICVGLPAAAIADGVKAVALVPLWYDGEGNEWFWSIRKIVGVIENEWKFE